MTRLLTITGLAFAMASNLAASKIAHFYFIQDDASRQSLERHYRKMNLISPVWFHVKLGGNVEVTVDSTLLASASKWGIPLLPVIVNGDFDAAVGSSVLQNPEISEKVIQVLITSAELYKLSGYQLDFENIAPQDRDNYVKFATRLGHLLHAKHKKLSVAVGAPLIPASAGNTSPLMWAASDHSKTFNYAGLSRAADSITLMAYDEYTSEPGPIAGLPWVKACLEAALTHIPAAKLLLGVSLYHRRWSGSKVTTGSYDEATALARKFRIFPSLHPMQQEMSFQLETNTVWFSNAESVAKRVELVDHYKLAGFSAWRLGQEDPAVWTKVFLERSKR